MLNTILFADDNESLTNYLSERTKEIGLSNIEFCISLRDVKKVLNTKKISRVILDRVFEGENEDGIDMLEYTKEKYPYVECYLLTGKPLDQKQVQRLKKIKALIILKANLTWERTFQLLSGECVSIPEPLKIESEIDIAELILKTEAVLDSFVSNASKLKLIRELPKKEVSYIDSKKNGLESMEYQAERFLESIQIAFNNINKTSLLDAKHLGTLNRLAIISISSSLIFLLLCLILILLGHTTASVVSGCISLLSLVIRTLIFRRVDKIRESMDFQKRSISSLYSTLLLFDFCQGIENKEARDKTISKLVENLSKKPAKSK